MEAAETGSVSGKSASRRKRVTTERNPRDLGRKGREVLDLSALVLVRKFARVQITPFQAAERGPPAAHSRPDAA